MNKNGKYYKVCIILSGGVGTRLGASTPKQYIEVNGKSILEYALNAVISWKDMDSLIVVADKNWFEYIRGTVEKIIKKHDNGIRFFGFAEPGKNRQLSIYNALKTLKDHMSKDAQVMIHDGVRPCLSSELIERCNAAFENSMDVDGVMPYLEVKDTVYLKDADGNISGMLDRSSLAAGQTPEFFDYWKYLRANEALSEDEMMAIHGSTEPAVKAGMKITLVPGDEDNFKITTKQDLERFTSLGYNIY